MVPLVSRQTAKGWLWALAIGIFALWQFHIPQFASKFDTFPGDRGDARLVAYLMEHWYQFFRGAEFWRSPGMFYPVPGTLGYADLLFAYGVLHSLLRTLGLGIFEAAEFTIIIYNFLNYLVCFVLLNKVLRFNLAASIAGAIFFAFNGPKLMELGHTQLQPVFFLPLATIAIVLFVQHRDKLSLIQAFGLIAVAAASLNLQLLTGFYAAWFFIFWSALFLVLTLLFTDTRRVVLQSILKFWPAFLGSLVVFAIGLLPFLKAYLPVLKLSGGRDYQQVSYFIPRPVSFLLTSQRNYLWGSTTTEILERVKGIDPELQISIGLIPSLTWIALAIFAVWLVIRNFKARPEFSTEKRTNVLFLAELIIATSLVYLIGVKYWEGFSPWQYVYQWFPGGQAIRAVARYAMIMALPMGIAFAWLIDHISQRIARQQPRGRRALLLATLYVLTVFGLGEQFARKEGFNGFSIKDENLYLSRLAQDLPSNCSSFYVTVGPTAPHNEFEYQLDAAMVSAMRNVPTLNGYSGYLPPTWDLWAVKDTVAYENNVKRWIADHKLPGNVCRLPISEVTGPEFVDINKPEVFVRQLYLDVLGRLPDPTGFQTWTTMLQQCPNLGGPTSDPKCDRIHVSQELLNSAEFVERSGFVLRLYLSTLGRKPLYEEFMRDRLPIAGARPDEVRARKQQLIAEWVQRPEFKSLYDGLADGAFVDKLLKTAANSSTNRSALVAALDAKQKTRADVILAVVEDQQTVAAFRNQGLVLMQFFAYLSRDPKNWEYEDRLNAVEAKGDYRQMIFDFAYSVEYRKRFGYLN
jgi:hypothetical protein